MIEFVIKQRAVNNDNAREHWAVKAKRVKPQRQAALLKCPKWTEGHLLVVELTRVGKGELDDDGLRSSLKPTRDGIAARLRVNDNSPLVRWDYLQKKGDYEIRVRIYRADE